MIDVRTYGAIPDGATDCSSAVNAALLVGDVIIQNGDFVVASSILIPSNRTVYIRNAWIKLADASYDNIFRNADLTGDENIKIVGLGNAIIDGNAVGNNDNYTTYGKGGAEFSYKYNLIVLCGVTTFEISGLTIVDHVHWTIMIQDSSFGSLHDIYLNHKTLTVNQDGIDFHTKCHDIDIYNIKGNVADDFFAINLHPGADLCVAINGHDTGDCYNIECYNWTVYYARLGSVLAVVPYLGNKTYSISSHDHILYEAGSIFYTYVFDSITDKTHVKDITFNDIQTITNMGRGGLFFILLDVQNVIATDITDTTGDTMMTIVNDPELDNVVINGVDYSQNP